MLDREHFAEYRCGCVSEPAAKVKDLLNYCRIHGERRTRTWSPPPPREWEQGKAPARKPLPAAADAPELADDEPEPYELATDLPRRGLMFHIGT